MPHYRRSGKIQVPLTPGEFEEGMIKGRFVDPKHTGFVTLIYYTGVRKKEALRTIKEQIRIEKEDLLYDVLKRLKGGIPTPVLNIPLDLPYVNSVFDAWSNTRPGKRIWPYSDKTGYNIVARVFPYPHYLRLSRITNFFMPSPGRPEGYSIAEVKAWTGLTLKTLDYYVGLAKVKKMGKELR